MSLKGLSLYRAMIKRGFSMLMSQVLWKEELSGQTQTKGLRGVGGNLEELKVKDRGPGRYSTLGGLLGKGHWTLTQTYVWRRSLLGRGFPVSGLRKQGPWETRDGRRWVGGTPYQAESMQKE